jgi:hypothetical protein
MAPGDIVHPGAIWKAPALSLSNWLWQDQGLLSEKINIATGRWSVSPKAPLLWTWHFRILHVTHDIFFALIKPRCHPKIIGSALCLSKIIDGKETEYVQVK